MIRTVVACIIPRAAVNHSFLLMMPSSHPQIVAHLYANLLSIPFDYCARQKVGGVNLPYFTMRQLPAFRPEAYAMPAPWAPSTRIRDWLLPRVLELTYTAWDLKAFAEDCGDDAPPFIWIPIAASDSGARSTRPSSICTASRGMTPLTSSTRFRSSSGRKSASMANTGRSEWSWRPTMRWRPPLRGACGTTRRSDHRGG